MSKAEQFKARKRLVREIAEALKVPTPKASEASVFAGFDSVREATPEEELEMDAAEMERRHREDGQ